MMSFTRKKLFFPLSPTLFHAHPNLRSNKLVHLTQTKIPHSQTSPSPPIALFFVFFGRAVGAALNTMLVSERVSPLYNHFRGFFTDSFWWISYQLFPRFFYVGGRFPAQHFAQHSIHRRIFNELNNCLFNSKGFFSSAGSIEKGW
jgi:hypothetical protein